MAENVKVAVRVRPFNAREKARNAKLVIDMKGNTTIIKDPENPDKKPKEFTFDHSYWSHDGATEREDGMFVADSPHSRYCDQQKVFDDLGQGMLSNAWKGYNCSLFAYGQTGSGKSYSVMGYGANKGIVPLLCDELFRGVEEKGADCQVSLSMLEIYNECVHDLLSTKKREKGGMKIRNHPNKGFYVEGLTVTPVQNFAAIENRIDEGTKNRTVAATQMNATSSRAHTIVTIHFSQKNDNASGQSMTKTASINLVDLAGSERADSTGATGDRLKEGSAINKSLSSLGNVIAALADAADPSKKKKVMVPFRDSVLTMLLKNALSGNSKTIMCAALSPADINYDETVSTLRFADRAKQIKTTAVVNESPTDKLIRELREENAKLQAMLKGGKLPTQAASGSSVDPAELKKLEEAKRQAQEELERQMRQNQEEMNRMQQSWEERLKAAEQKKAEEDRLLKIAREEKQHIPHLWNMNEDSALEGVVCHFINYEKNATVGNKKKDPPPDIVFGGLGIEDEHAIIESDGSNKFTIRRCSPNAKVLLNGETVKDDKMELRHHSRVLFGNNHLYCFENPKERDEATKAGVKWMTPTYSDAQAEIAEKAGYSTAEGSAGGLQDELVSIMPHVNEANAISVELDKKCFFEIILMAAPDVGGKKALPEINVKVHDLARQISWLWSRDTFLNRKYIMQEMYQLYSDKEDWDRKQEEDPFWEPVQHQLLGSAFLYLGGLSYLIDIDETIAITDAQGQERGHVHAKIGFGDQTGDPLGEEDLDDLFVDEPKESLGRRIDLLFTVVGVKGINKDDANEVYCTYQFMDMDMIETPKISGKVNPNFKHTVHLPIPKITSEHLDYFEKEAVKICVYTKPKPRDPKEAAGLSTAELLEKHRDVRPTSGTVRRRSSVARWLADDDQKGSQANNNNDGNNGTGDEKGGKLQVAMTDKQKAASLADVHADLHKAQCDAARDAQRARRLQDKLKRIEKLVDKAKADGSSTVAVRDLEKALHPSQAKRFKAVVKVVIMTNRMEKMKKALALEAEKQGKSTATKSKTKAPPKPEKPYSKLCSIQ